MSKRILIVSHDVTLRQTRSLLLERAGYCVSTAEGAAMALQMLETDAFDLIVMGRDSLGDKKGATQIIRERYADLPILKIVEVSEEGNRFASRITNRVPENILTALREMMPPRMVAAV